MGEDARDMKTPIKQRRKKDRCRKAAERAKDKVAGIVCLTIRVLATDRAKALKLVMPLIVRSRANKTPSKAGVLAVQGPGASTPDSKPDQLVLSI